MFAGLSLGQAQLVKNVHVVKPEREEVDSYLVASSRLHTLSC